jgi:hypothetical protein
MLDWLRDIIHDDTNLALGDLALRLGLAFLFGFIVAGVYVLSQRKPLAEMIPFATTIVLLTILIAMVTLVIGNNVARAFSLAGALAIIRFRTVVEDTRDTAFVIFAVVVGMGIGAGLLLVPLVGTPVVAAAAFLLSFSGSRVFSAAADYSLNVRLGLGRAPEVLKEMFAKHLSRAQISGVATARQGSALDLTYCVRLRRPEDAAALITDLNQIEGVQHAELREP